MLADRLKAWRESSGLTQTDVARYLGVRPSAVSHWEAGRTPPSTKHLARFVELIGITLGSFYGRLPRKGNA